MTKLRNKINSNMSADIKLSKAPINRITQTGGFLGRSLGKFLPKLIKPATSLLTNVGLPLGLSAADAAIQKSIFSGSGGNRLNDLMNILRICHNGLNDIMKIIKVLEDNNVLPKGITRTAKNEVKSQRGGFLTTLLGGLATSLLVNMLFGSGIKRAGEGVKKAGYELKKLLMQPHPLRNLDIQDYFNKEERFNSVYSRNNLPKLKKGAYVINLDHNKNTGTHWVVLFVKSNEVIYFDSFCVEYIPEEIMERIKNKNIKTNIFRIQTLDSIMCGYYCVLFIEFMLKGKTLTDFTNLFSPWDF